MDWLLEQSEVSPNPNPNPDPNPNPGAELEARATHQQNEDPAALARRASLSGEHTLALSSKYTMSSGGGVPWVVDERASWYKLRDPNPDPNADPNPDPNHNADPNPNPNPNPNP